MLEHDDCIDQRRVYMTGLSGGGRMASQMACDASDVIAAVAPVAGLRAPDPCPPTRPVPVIAFHGTADPVDPYEGHGQTYWTYSVPAAAARWAGIDHCATTPTTSTPVSSVAVTVYSRCGAGAQVELFTVAGDGHEWPGGPALPDAVRSVLGPQSNAVDTDARMWAFFESHPLS